MDTNALRILVEGVDREMRRFVEPAQEGAAQSKPADALTTAWTKLVHFLALGPAPELRKCPHCGAAGMRAAIRCGHCWNTLIPPPPHGASPRS